MVLPSSTALSEDGESVTKEPMIVKTAVSSNHLKSSAPFPSPVPTSWATPANMSAVRANTPLGLNAAASRAAGVPQPPPSPAPPQSNGVHLQAVEPATKSTRSKSDASTKGKAGSAFKRMFGGSAVVNGLSNAVGSAVDELNHPLSKMGLTPANGSSSVGHTPSSERGDPLPDTGLRDRRVSQPSAPRPASRAASVKDDRDSTPVPASGAPTPLARPPSRASSTDGRFNLKDLIPSGQKLSRKSSASSRKSDSSRGDDIPLHGGGYTSGPESFNGRPRSRAPSSVGGDSATSLSQKYGVCDKIPVGKGATSVVRLAHKWDRKDEKLYAVKEFRKRRKNESEKDYVKKLTAEFCISSTLHHPNVVETVDLVQDEHQNWCEVMEFCPGGDLYAAIKRGGMSPSEVECSFKQILLGVEYLHSQGVAHRDLKPENLFFDAKGQLKIGDYGASTVYRLPWEKSIHMSTGLCGSEPYIAPEQFAGGRAAYDARLVDIWACGIVYYCLHFQELPWRVAQPTDRLFAAYVAACNSKNPAESECPETINNLSPRACRPLLRKMLEPNPAKRILIEEVMKDAWVQQIEVCTLVNKPRHIHVNAMQMTGGGASSRD